MLMLEGRHYVQTERGFVGAQKRFCYGGIIIIITLFQEDNIFGTNASLTYGPQIKDMHGFDNYKTMKIIYSIYRASEVFIHLACCEPATQPYSLGGERYDLSRLKTSRCYHT